MVRPEAPAPTPSRFGPYRIVHVLRGDGARGCARGSIAGGRAVLLRWGPADERPEVSGPRREHAALAEVAAHGTPEPIELFEVDGLVVSVSAWIDGESLLRRRPQDLAAAATELFEILDRAHAVGWVHGDVTPSNVLVDDAGRLHLVDWDLAARTGEPTSPGTLGYAPPTAWAPGFRADPASDCYAAAVVLMELNLGRRLFEGDRAATLAAQCCGATALRDATTLEATLGGVAECLDAGGRRDPIHPLRRLLRVRAARLGEIAARTEGDAVAARIAAIQKPTSEPLGIAVTDDASVDDISFAVIEALRRKYQIRAVCLRSLLRRSSSEPEAGRGATRTDAARTLRVQRIRLLREYIETTSATVVATDGDVLGFGCGGWIEAAEGALHPTAGGRGTLVQLIPRTTAPQPLDRSRVGEVLNCLMLPLPCPQELKSMVYEHAPRSSEEVQSALARLVRSALVEVRSDGTVSVSDTALGAIRAWRTARDASAGSSARGPSDGVDLARSTSDTSPSDAEAAILWGEAAALAALPSQVVRACIRASTAIRSSECRADLRGRLCDLWLDVGRPDAGIETLTPTSDTPESLEDVARLGQCLAALERYPEAAAVGTRLESLATDPGQRLEALRLRILGELHGRRTHEAMRLVRAGRVWRRRATVERRLLFDITSANCLRRIQRRGRAARMLHTVMRCAEQRGSVRLALIAETNLVLAETRAPAFMADRFERIAAHMRRWGLMVQAAHNVMRAARYWAGADDVDAAIRNLRDVRADMGLGVVLGEHVTSELRVREAEALDRRDAPYLISWGCHVRAEEMLCGSNEEISAIHRQTLEMELGIAGDGGVHGGPRKSLRRWVRSALRIARSGGASPSRIAKVLRGMARALPERSPVVGHVAREIVRGAPSAVSVFETVRSQEGPEGGERCLLEGLSIMSCVWGAEVTRDAAWWVLTEVPREERRRPPGVRAWEFQLAFAVAESVVGHLEDGPRTAERVLEGIEAFAGRLPPEKAAGYLERIPWARIVGLAGVLPEGLGVLPGPVRSVDGIRGVQDLVRGTAPAGGDAGRREAGLRRVLRAALRLRATGTLDEVLGEIALGVLEVCRAERALVLYDTGAGGPRAKLATYAGVSSIDVKAAEFSEGVLDRVRTTNGVCIVDDAADDSQLGHRPSVKSMGARSIMVAPLRTATRHFGFLYVENRSLPRCFVASDRELIEGFAAQAGLALENNQLVEELRASNKDLAHARGEAVRSENLRVLGRMAGEVAHDFNNLLTSILGEAQLLMEDPRAHAVRDRLAVIERAALDGAATIRRIQDSTRVRTDADFETVDLAQVVRDVVDLTRVRWASGRAPGAGAIDLVVDSAPGVFVRGIGSELREVVTNLVVNAVDAMPLGGRIEVAARAEGGQAEVRVSDTGCGMPAEVVARIFDPFFTTKGERGNGLGLCIAHGIVKRHGGEIRVASEVGRGTTMTIALPAAPADASGEGWVARFRSGASPALAPVRRALVVDDDPSVLRVVSELLRSEGFVVETASGGASALVRIQGVAEPFDLVLTDLFMPEVNGLDVAAEVKRRGAALRTIVMSGCTMTLQGGALEGHSVDGVLRKPFSREELRLVA